MLTIGAVLLALFDLIHHVSRHGLAAQEARS